MPFTDLNKTGMVYDMLKDYLNSSERMHLMQFIVNDLDEKDLLDAIIMLKNRGFLEPFGLRRLPDQASPIAVPVLGDKIE